MSALSTRATEALAAAGVDFRHHPYQLDGEGDLSYGEAVAAVLGVPPERVFKTLLAEVDGRPVVAVVPVRSRLWLKALAKAAGGKKAEMADPAVAERLTGYVTGGISPFGQRRRLPTYLDRSALDFPTIYVSGGRRGLQLELSPHDLVRLLEAVAVPLTAD